MLKNPPEFNSLEAAKEWLIAELTDAGENDIDNVRAAFYDDYSGMAEYDRIVEHGCCGSIDMDVTVNGKAAQVGANYGH
jgi:hypothetical protein